MDFPKLNQGYARVFEPGRLSLGLVVPLEAYPNTLSPTMEGHIKRAQLADRLGFAALWLRDVPFNVPSFGDTGQGFDPFVYLGTLGAVTTRIALATGSIILPLRHPAHVAKAAASADQLSGGRLILGVASGDRPQEYPALGMSFPDRGARFRDSFDYIRAVAGAFPTHDSAQGILAGDMDMLPKPVAGHTPMLVTGGSQQSPEWVAQNGDGWVTYPRDAATQGRLVGEYRARSLAAGRTALPVSQSLYIDLVADPYAEPSPIHLGFRSGVTFLRSYLNDLQRLGINHVAINLRFNTDDVEETMKRLADALLPDFPTKGDAP